ncbi:MAG: ribonuclease P protein component [Patescibacteria group bacterium]|nr:ribonuclease P protein component [Patescibacteria group bacterium]
MLAKKFKLREADNIKDILDKGKESKSRYFVVKYQSQSDHESRFAITISRKLEKSAVKRNRFKRQILEIIRLNEVPKGLEIVILPRFAAIELDYKELEKELLYLLNKL